eukprot:COSAG02_NODE_3259_length_7079_cov_30.942693_2_plen_559_part_00
MVHTTLLASLIGATTLTCGGSAGAAIAPSSFPAMIFGANESGPESTAQLGVDSQFPLVIYGWQHGLHDARDGGSVVHFDAGRRGAAQCAALRRQRPDHACFVYRHAALAMPMFAEERAVMTNASRRHWFMINPRTGLPVVNDGWANMPQPNMTQAWNFSVPEASDYFVESIVRPLAEDPDVSGVFFDMVDWTACAAAEWMRCGESSWFKGTCGLPFPGGEAGRRAYFDTVWALYKRVAGLLDSHGKTALYSSTNYVSNVSWPDAWSRNNSYDPLPPGTGGGNSNDPGSCPKPLDAAIAAMGNTPWTRYYEHWLDVQHPDSRTDPLATRGRIRVNRSKCIWQIEDALSQAEAGVPMVMHTGVSSTADGAQHLAVNLSLAAFLLAADLHQPGSYFGFSFGDMWEDDGWARIPLYDSDPGTALGPAERVGCCEGYLQNHTYMHDAEGFSDLYNTELHSAEACARLCCSEGACAGFQWTSRQGGPGDDGKPAGNCTGGGACCWIKPTIGRIEHITYDATNSSLEQYYMVSGTKKGMAWRRSYENVEVTVDCAVPSSTMEWRV